jgi:squalene synthase HpnD
MNPETTPAALRSKVSGSSFYAGMRVLPKAEREAMYAIYGFCRIVDDIADDLVGDRSDRAAALDAWRRDIDALYAGGDAGQAAFLRSHVERFGLERDDFEAVIDGMAMDVEGDIRWQPMATVDLYCDRVASAVGRLSVKVFGMEAETGRQLAHHLGRALQLTNILRDLDEDAAIGRVYLAGEHLTAAGVPLTAPTDVVNHPNIDAACRPLAAIAREHYRQAAAILATRPRGHLIAPRLMELAYAKVLRRMEGVGWTPPRRRTGVNKAALLFAVARFSLAR